MLSFGIVFISLGSIAPDLKVKLNLNELETGGKITFHKKTAYTKVYRPV